MTTAPTESIINYRESALPAISIPAEVFDPISDCRLIIGTPDSSPHLWRRYLDGARDSYRAHGVSVALDYDRVVDGRDTTLFFAAVDKSGEIRGGLRAQGPYLDVSQTHALVEWEGRPGRDDLIASIRLRLSDGVVEMKSAWVDPGAASPSSVSSLLARVTVPTMAATGARYMMATAAEHVLRRWSTSGGRVDSSVPASPYPDERYRTSLMWWDRRTMLSLSEPTVRQQIRREADLWAVSGGMSGRSVA